jgi:hypothetical protein
MNKAELTDHRPMIAPAPDPDYRQLLRLVGRLFVLVGVTGFEPVTSAM